MSSMLLLLSLFMSLVPIPAEANVETFVAALAGALQDVAKEQADHRVIAERPGLHRVDSNDKKTDNTGRARRSSSYSPYTSDPYDMGPIGMCSYPQLDVCDFPDGYTVPEYVARTVFNYNDLLNKLNDEFNEAGSGCAESMMDFMCNQIVTPRCISNTTVQYPSGTLSKCQEAISSCPTNSAMESICNRMALEQPTGTFSLTQCRVPSVSGCSSTRPSPDWIVAEFEHVTTENSLEDVTTTVGLTGSCKENYIRLACTRPTCESNGRLQGYRSAAQCNSVLDCLSDPTVRETVKEALQCSHMDELRQPSPAAGRNSPTSSGDRTSSYVGIAVASLLLIILV